MFLLLQFWAAICTIASNKNSSPFVKRFYSKEFREFMATEIARQIYLVCNFILQINYNHKNTQLTQSIHEELETFADTKRPILMRVQKLCEILDLVDEKKDFAMRSTDYNWPQLKRYTVYGCLLAGPVLHGWYFPVMFTKSIRKNELFSTAMNLWINANAANGRYKWLDTFYNGKSTRIVLKKLFMDQFIFTPPLIVLFFTSLCPFALLLHALVLILLDKSRFVFHVIL